MIPLDVASTICLHRAHGCPTIKIPERGRRAFIDAVIERDRCWDAEYLGAGAQSLHFVFVIALLTALEADKP